MGSLHFEIIIALPDLEPATLRERIDERCPGLVEWQIGGPFRGAHEPGGPHPDADVTYIDFGGTEVQVSTASLTSNG